MSVPPVVVHPGFVRQPARPPADRGAWLVDLGAPRPCLSGGLLGAGLRPVRWLVNRSVVKGWDPADPVADMRAWLLEHNLDPDACAALCTGVDAAHGRRAAAERDGWRVEVLATAAAGNAACAGGRFPLDARSPGTINLLILVHGALAPAAFVHAVQTATEAKVRALAARGVTTAWGEPATGTTTDALAIACLGDGPPAPYAGCATPVGWALGRAACEAVGAALDRAAEATRSGEVGPPATVAADTTGGSGVRP